MTAWDSPDSFGLQSFAMDNTRYLAYKRQLEISPEWSFYAAIPYSVIVQRILHVVVIQAISICIFLLLMILLLTWLIRRYLTRPITELARVLSAIDPVTDSGTRLPEALAANTRELKDIVQAMNEMVIRAEEAKEDLARSEVLFRTVSEFSSEWIFWRSPDGQMVYTSPSCEEVTGYSQQDFYRQDDLIEQIVHPDDKWICMGHYKDNEDDQPHEPIEFRIAESHCPARRERSWSKRKSLNWNRIPSWSTDPAENISLPTVAHPSTM